MRRYASPASWQRPRSGGIPSRRPVGDAVPPAAAGQGGKAEARGGEDRKRGRLGDGGDRHERTADVVVREVQAARRGGVVDLPQLVARHEPAEVGEFPAVEGEQAVIPGARVVDHREHGRVFDKRLGLGLALGSQHCQYARPNSLEGRRPQSPRFFQEEALVRREQLSRPGEAFQPEAARLEIICADSDRLLVSIGFAGDLAEHPVAFSGPGENDCGPVLRL